MSAPNRVTPFGTIEALPGRGTLMGNRGSIHEGRTIKRPYASKAWITCVLEFPPASRRTAQEGWRAPMWEPNRWTPLFFLDEATSLAAGHRPCALCRRADHQRFRTAWGDTPLAVIDATLHEERLVGRGRASAKCTVEVEGDLPDGAMVALDDRAWLVLGGSLRAWSMDGYGDERPCPKTVTLLTPPSLVDVLWRGYAPMLHETAR